MKTKQKIAIFRNIEHGYESILDGQFDSFEEYVRLSEFVEVEFQPLTGDEFVQKQLSALDKAESALRAQFQIALNGIEQQRQELRAITYQPA